MHCRRTVLGGLASTPSPGFCLAGPQQRVAPVKFAASGLVCRAAGECGGRLLARQRLWARGGHTLTCSRGDGGLEIPFLILRSRDWVKLVRAAACQALKTRVHENNGDFFLRCLPLLERVAEPAVVLYRPLHSLWLFPSGDEHLREWVAAPASSSKTRQGSILRNRRFGPAIIPSVRFGSSCPKYVRTGHRTYFSWSATFSRLEPTRYLATGERKRALQVTRPGRGRPSMAWLYPLR